VEITPNHIRLRKTILSAHTRYSNFGREKYAEEMGLNDF